MLAAQAISDSAGKKLLPRDRSYSSRNAAELDIGASVGCPWLAKTPAAVPASAASGNQARLSQSWTASGLPARQRMFCDSQSA